jgi:crotonobetainyl-CoA:carnitine CoA-transferase CaiB-like acyl-CoA transferase
MNQGALTNIRVIDLSRVLAGPYCTMMLADYGAEVIKVERPGSGDGTRQWGPPWVGDESAYFLSVNRNKKSITLNLKTDEGKTIVKRLAADADVVIENFKPGTMARMGLDYETLSADNPGLIFCAISGYGQNGRYRDRPGYDFMIQAQGGIMSITGPADGEPHKVGVAIVDITTGLIAANAILAALHHRTQTGQGQFIDVALLDAQVAWLANVAHNYFATATPIPILYLTRRLRRQTAVLPSPSAQMISIADFAPSLTGWICGTMCGFRQITAVSPTAQNWYRCCKPCSGPNRVRRGSTCCSPKTYRPARSMMCPRF